MTVKKSSVTVRCPCCERLSTMLIEMLGRTVCPGCSGLLVLKKSPVPSTKSPKKETKP